VVIGNIYSPRCSARTGAWERTQTSYHFQQHFKLIFTSVFNSFFIYITLQTKTWKSVGTLLPRVTAPLHPWPGPALSRCSCIALEAPRHGVWAGCTYLPDTPWTQIQ